MNDITISTILFYADYLSIKERGIPVTDNCKYFFIHELPVNSAYIVGSAPFYDESDEYFKQSKFELDKLEEYSGEDGMMSLVNGIGSLLASGMCDGERLLKYIHQYSEKAERRNAMRKYAEYMDDIQYTKTTINEDGNPQIIECTKYYAHAERMRNGSKIPIGIRNNTARL